MIKKWYIELHIEERLERKLCVSKVELQVEGLFDGWLLKLYNIIMNVKEWMEIYQIKRSFRYLFDSSPQGHVLIHLMCIYAMVTPFHLHCGGSSHGQGPHVGLLSSISYHIC